MVFDKLRKLIAGGGEPAPTEEPVTHEGYVIQPLPERDGGGWRVQADISREIDGEMKTHRFIRADTFPDKAAAVSTTILKAKRVIDEQGERLFRDT